MIFVTIWSVGFIIFAVYSLTISPSIAGGDSGEIVAEGCHLGTAHPPGYPLMTLLVYGLAKLPSSMMTGVVDVLREITKSPILQDTVAFRVNMFCASCTSLAAIYMGSIIQALTPMIEGENADNAVSSFSVLPGIVIGMFMFAFSPLIWQYAITAEVFALNNFLSAYMLWLVVDFSKRRQISTAIYGAFICGIALCNQHTIILFEAPLILWMIFLLRHKLMASYALFGKISLAFIIGVIPYAYLPIAATISPKAGSWGHVTTIQGFLHHFLRKDYGTFQLFSGNGGKKTEGFMERSEAYFKDAVHVQGLNFAPYLALGGVALCVFWIMTNEQYCLPLVNILGDNDKSPSIVLPTPQSSQPSSMKNKKKVNHNSKITSTRTLERPVCSIEESECKFTGVVLVFTYIFYFLVFHSLSNLPLHDKLLYGVHQRFWMQPNVLLFTFSGLGLNFFIGLMRWIVIKRRFLEIRSKTADDSKRSERSLNDGKVRHCDLGTVNSTQTPESAVILSKLVCLGGLFLSLYTSYLQLNRWFHVSNQSQVNYFKNYAQSILAPLPENAILIVNYDQQWTSIRYIQICENYRPDITTLQLSMMTYKWFQYKHNLYRTGGNNSIVFPGTYSTFPKSPAIIRDNAFTLLQFLDANYENHEIFLGGKVTHPDDDLAAKYDMVPVGLVSKFTQILHVPNGTVYSTIAENSWLTVQTYLPRLPDTEKYPEETWEWTIGRDYKDRLMGKYYFIEIHFFIISSF